MMNEEQARPPAHANDELNLGTQFSIDLGPLSNSGTDYTIEKFIAALEATTVLTVLKLDISLYDPTLANNLSFIQPLCRCVSNLSKHHPLRELVFCSVYSLDLDRNGVVGIFQQLLVAAKQFGIRCTSFYRMNNLTVQGLVEFCHDNSNLKELYLSRVSFTDDGGAAESWLPNDGPQNFSSILALDKLTLTRVKLKNSTVASKFANLVAHVNVSKLRLGAITVRASVGGDDDEYDVELAKGIVSELMKLSVEQLYLYEECRLQHYKAALDAGTTSLSSLTVYIRIDDNDASAKLNILTSYIRGAVKLSSLTIRGLCGVQFRLPLQFFQALEACATVADIQVDYETDGRNEFFSQPEIRQLQRIANRNHELARFFACPSIYPSNQLLTLMRQLDNCPTGRFMLARHLPSLFSFF